jgi:hypothetical protein
MEEQDLPDLTKLDLVNLSEIGRRAGVQRSTVCNWRKRHKSFPEPFLELPVGAVWPWRSIERWLKTTGRLTDPGAARMALAEAALRQADADASEMAGLLDEFLRLTDKIISGLPADEVAARVETLIGALKLLHPNTDNPLQDRSIE